MSKESLMDDILKEKAKSENLKLPKDLDIKIDKTLLDLPDRNKLRRGKGFKNFVTAAAITLIIITCFTVAFPTYARNIPIVKSVLELLSEKNIVDKDYIEYSSDLNLSDVSNGVKVTINSIVYDGAYLSIAYTVESENEINVTPHIMEKDLKINGEVVSFSSGSSGRLLNKNTYLGLDTFSVSYDYLPEEIRKDILGGDVEIPENFTMDLNIKEFYNGILGDWNFKFKVSKDKIGLNVSKVNLSEDLSEIRDGLEITEVIFTPINTILRSREDNNELAGDIGNFIVVDDKGRNLRVLGGNGSGSNEISKFYSQERYTNIYEDTNSVTFIPVIYKEGLAEDYRERSRKYDKREVPLNKDDTTILSYGEIGEYKITKVEFLEDKTLIHYKVNGFIATKYAYNLAVVDNNGKECLFIGENVREEDNKFIAEIEALSLDKEYILRAPDFGKVYEVKENFKFTVDVKQ